ncbi:hypothetical protein JCM6882_006541 [Rhodosporidiobolus microsporus]
MRLLQRLFRRTRPPPPLPAEIVLYILELAALSDWTTLPLIALVSSQTRDWAQHRLYHRAVLRSTSSVKRFTRTIQLNPSLGARTRTLVVDAGKPSGRGAPAFKSLPASLEAVVTLLPALKEVELRHLAIYSVVDFAAAAHITHLTLYSCLLSDTTSEYRNDPYFISLPSLHTLTLKHVQLGASTAETFLSPRSMPALRVLHSEGVRLFIVLRERQYKHVDAGPLDMGKIRPGMQKVDGGIGVRAGWREEKEEDEASM